MGIITLIYTKKMQKMMLFRGLPCVLQDLVMRYAYNMPVDAVRKEVRRILEVKHMGLPFFLFRTKVWSWEFSCFLPSPLRVFTPIARYGGYYGDLVDEDVVYYLLLCLDFRRRNVRMFGTREEWYRRLEFSWEAIGPFAAYYKMLLRSGTRVLKKCSRLWVPQHYISAAG